MPRPTDFDAAMLAFCDDEIARFREAQRRGEDTGYDSIPDTLFEVAHFREAWYCGTWLQRKLRAAGCADKKARRICFANGQKIAMSRDPWLPTVRTLQRYLADGSHDQPGPELAERLWREAGAEINGKGG